MKAFLRSITLLMVVIITANAVFFALHHASNLIPVAVIKERVNEAFQHDNLIDGNYPHRKFGLSSNHSLIGLDQFSDCLSILMSLHRGPSALNDVLVPRVAAPAESPEVTGQRQPCVDARRIAAGETPVDIEDSYPIQRYWFGSKAVLALALPVLGFFEINNLIKVLSYLGYFLFGAAIMTTRRDAFPVFMPVIVLGMLFSGIHYYGGVYNSLPYLFSLLVIVILTVSKRFTTSSAYYLGLFAVAGAGSAFFHGMTGALLMTVGLSVVVLYFITLEERPVLARYKWIALHGMAFFAGFFGSVVIHQLAGVVVLGWEEVVSAFRGELNYRMSNTYDDYTFSTFEVVVRQLENFHYATYGSKAIANAVKLASAAAWLGGIALTFFSFYVLRDRQVMLSALLLLVATVLVIARLAIFKNASFIHAHILSRYMFVVMSFGWMLLVLNLQIVWRRLSAARHFHPIPSFDEALGEHSAYVRFRTRCHLLMASMALAYVAYLWFR